MNKNTKFVCFIIFEIVISLDKIGGSLNNKDGENSDDPLLYQKLLKFPENFEAKISISSTSRGGGKFFLREQFYDDSVTLTLNESKSLQSSCAYSRATRLGHKIRGIKCEPTVNLPYNCFCPSHSFNNHRSLRSTSVSSGTSLQFGPWASEDNAASSFSSSPTASNTPAGVAKSGKDDVDPNSTASTSVVEENVVNNSNSGSLLYIPMVEILQILSNRFKRFEEKYEKEESSTNARRTLRVKNLGFQKFATFEIAGSEELLNISATFVKSQITEWQLQAVKVEVSSQYAAQYNCQPNRSSESKINNIKSISSITLEYEVMEFRLFDRADVMDLRSKAAWSPAPKGVFCPRPDIYKRQLPDIPDQFSVLIETADQLESGVTYSHQSYDLQHNIVSFRFSPRSHFAGSPAIFFTRLTAGISLRESYNVVHDFNTGLQYTVNERNRNCTMEAIPLTSPDAELTASAHVKDSLAHVKLKHAKELLDTDPSNFMYSGERWMRGILCDVWVAERFTDSGYQTTELFFSRRDWNLFIEEVNAHQELPVAIVSYYAPNKNASHFTNSVVSHYFEFNPSEPNWSDFDISSCVGRHERLYLKLTIDVSYSQIVQFNLKTVQDSLRKGIAQICGISPLRIINIHITSGGHSGSPDGIDIWFALLEEATLSILHKLHNHRQQKPQHQDSKAAQEPSKETVEGQDKDHHSSTENPTLKKMKNRLKNHQASMAEAYRRLGGAIAHKEVPIRLKLAPEQQRELLVRVRKNSLAIIGEANHPSVSTRVKNGSYHLLRAHYTAGTMAGLAFAMAILGISLGIFVGFLLWKRRIGLIPYYLQSPICSQNRSDMGLLSHSESLLAGNPHAGGGISLNGFPDSTLGNSALIADLDQDQDGRPLSPPPRY